MARKIWINVFDSFMLHTGQLENPPKHFNVSLAMGHVLPMDDFIINKDIATPLETYELIDPDLNKTALSMPVKSPGDVIRIDTGLTIECGDVAAQKISITDESKEGTYQVAASSKELFFKLKGLGNKLIDSKAQYFAKSFLKVGTWTQPNPIGHALELVPLNDLSNIRIGDPVTFQASFMGKPFTCTYDAMEYLIAASNTFGGEAGGDLEGFFLAAYLVNGKARFRMPTAGQWMIAAFNFKDVTPENEFKEFAEQCSRIYYHSTITFNVRA